MLFASLRAILIILLVFLLFLVTPETLVTVGLVVTWYPAGGDRQGSRSGG